MHAIVHMQPLDARRNPITGYPRKRLRESVPRDGEPHRVGESWELDAAREMPYYVQVWADDRSIVREIDCVGPEKLRNLNSITFYMMLTVLPKVH